MHAARLARTLQARSGAHIFGMGGPRMKDAGVELIADAKDIAVLGITEVIHKVPTVLKILRLLRKEAARRKPALAVLVDSPGTNLPLAKKLHRLGVPVVYFIAPQVWAWRPWRIRAMKKNLSRVLVIFPFEEKFYRDRGVDAKFVGHPLAGLSPPSADRESYAAMHTLDAAKPWVTLMPGSRTKEVRMNLPTILESTAKLGSGYEYLLPLAPTLDRSFLESLIGRHPIRLVSDALPALSCSRAGIIASGTATVEAAMMGTPFVMVYRVSALTYSLGRSRVKVPYFAMPNLIAGKEIVPELVQHDFTAEKVVARLKEILPDGPVRKRMIEGMAEVRTLLRGPISEALHPAERAAEAIVTLMQRSTVEA